MSKMCSHCMCCCCDENLDSASISSWLSGKFNKNTDEIKNEETFSTAVTIDKCIMVQQTSSVTIIQPSIKSYPPSPLTGMSEQSRSESILSDSTFGDVPCIDVRLGLFEEDRFKDVSEAIFKRHS